ncbi:hypothetical protein [Peribacillus frigoritolerans]|uniref:Uncharacterized protein n=1 Tax=Peribacillus castrilensis TaxID=2897690 RepID=A0AAW9NFX2_9BACI|nr:hypothetical protein [Peribacillus castrilensis]
MALQILQAGFEEGVRAKLGVSQGELPNEVINQRLVAELAESTIISRVPGWQSIVDTRELLLLEGSVISYICYLLAPSMSRRLNLSVTTLDVTWRKDKVDWQALADVYAGESDMALIEIESVEVAVGGDSKLVDYARNTRSPLV